MPVAESNALQAVLYAFSRVQALKERYTLKGGNALRMGHGSPRSSQDLDFTLKGAAFSIQAADHEHALASFLPLFNRGLKLAETKYGMVLDVTSAKVVPAKKDPRSFPSFEVKVGYCETAGPSFFKPVVKVEVSLNELVCEDGEVSLGDFTISLASLNDIVAEKLRAILQQPLRNRRRPRDFYDIWYFSKHHPALLDHEKIGKFLLQKAANRRVPISRRAFENPEIFERGATDFDQLRGTLPKDEPFPSFVDAAAAVRALVAGLALPDTHE